MQKIDFIPPKTDKFLKNTLTIYILTQKSIASFESLKDSQGRLRGMRPKALVLNIRVLLVQGFNFGKSFGKSENFFLDVSPKSHLAISSLLPLDPYPMPYP